MKCACWWRFYSAIFASKWGGECWSFFRLWSQTCIDQSQHWSCPSGRISRTQSLRGRPVVSSFGPRQLWRLFSAASHGCSTELRSSEFGAQIGTMSSLSCSSSHSWQIVAVWRAASPAGEGTPPPPPWWRDELLLFKLDGLCQDSSFSAEH